MVFSSLLFLFVFLPVFLVLYYVTPKKWRNVTALIGSYLFYIWGAPTFAFVLLGSSILDYWISKQIYDVTKQAYRKYWFTFALILNICLLGYYKYANFFVGEFSRALEFFGFSGVVWTYIALPIGISFFTFQKISYLIDVYRKDVMPAKTVWDFLLYVALFPQLIAGPIVKYKDIAMQLRSRIYSFEQFFSGMGRFALGLGKKVLIADQVAQIADIVFSLAPENMQPWYVWIGVLAYSIQILFDFSGYSDMAIGLGRMMGFEFKENFNHPYISKSFTEFWKRWHISLSTWMKQYLYIPLGGNRVSKIRMYCNLWIVFLFSGLWHGASWTFIAWGIFHGMFLVIDKMWWLKKVTKIPSFVAIVATYVWILLGWVLFRSESFSRAWEYVIHMFGFGKLHSAPEILFVEIATNRALAMLMVGVLLSFFPYFVWYQKFVRLWKEHVTKNIFIQSISFIGVIVLISLSAMNLVNSGFHPFIYFRF